MQLVRLSKSLKPLTLAVGLFSSTTMYAYSDIDGCSSLYFTSSNKIAEYLDSVDKNGSLFISQKLRFRYFFENWEKNTIFLSSAQSIIEDENFKAIVSMGNIAVPYIIEEIEKKPSTLVWALNIILDRKITTNPKATISDACKLWVKELKK